jgi:hypothetical protein
VHTFHYRNNSGAMADEHKGKKWFMRIGALGLPDIVCVIDGQSVGTELKGTGGRQSDEQKESKRRQEAAGGQYILAYSLDDITKLCLSNTGEQKPAA